MIDLYQEFEAPILAIEKVPVSEIHRYGVISGEQKRNNVYRIDGLVEKPSPSHAPSDIAIIGRYILTADIFAVLDHVQPGKGGEIQLTDALAGLLQRRPIYGYLFAGKRYDAGDKVGYLKATVDLALKNHQVATQFRKYLLTLAMAGRLNKE